MSSRSNASVRRASLSIVAGSAWAFAASLAGAQPAPTFSVATAAGSRDAERAAVSVATDAGSRDANPSDPAAIRARLHA